MVPRTGATVTAKMSLRLPVAELRGSVQRKFPTGRVRGTIQSLCISYGTEPLTSGSGTKVSVTETTIQSS